MLTVQDLKQALPKNLQNNATQEFCDLINNVISDPEEAREVRENFVTYSSVLLDGTYKTEDYLNAVTYCTFKFMGLTNKAAYQKAFPDRYTRLVAAGKSDKEISAYVAAYHKNKLVNTILQQALIPAYILNQDAFQKAINTQVQLMEGAQSEMVRTTAANSLLVALKQPEVKKIEMDVGVKGGGLGELRDTLATLVQKQVEMIQGGASARQMARIPIGGHDETIIDVTPRQVPKQEPEPVRAAPQPVLTRMVKDAVEGGTGVAKVTYDEEKKEVTMAHVPRMSLFQGPFAAPKVTEDLKSPGANFAKCCNQSIENCVCVEPEHIYLPTDEDVPQIKRSSLFDDPADMP